MGSTQTSYWRPEYAADPGGGTGVRGLAICVVCRSIASVACWTCGSPTCDTVCLAAHWLDCRKAR